MNPDRINKQSSVPLHEQLKELIVSAIDRGDLKPHDQLDSERIISLTHDISRQTVRQTINELVLNGILYRRPGKGTYISPHKITQDLLHVTSFTQLMLDWGKQTSSQVISCERTHAPPFARRLLEISEEQEVVYLERVRMVDDEPFAVHRSYIPYDLDVEAFAEALSTESLMSLLEATCALEIKRSQETMEPTLANATEAKLLGVVTGAPLQLIKGRLISSEGRAVECHKSLYRGDRFQFTFEGILNERSQGVLAMMSSEEVSMRNLF